MTHFYFTQSREDAKEERSVIRALLELGSLYGDFAEEWVIHSPCSLSDFASLRETFLFHAKTRRRKGRKIGHEGSPRAQWRYGEFAGDDRRWPGLELSLKLRLSLHSESAVPHWFSHLILLELKVSAGFRTDLLYACP